MPSPTRPDAPAELRLKLPGQVEAVAAPPATEAVGITSSRRVALGASRAGGGSAELDAAPDDVVKIDLGDGIILWSRADDLLRERGQPAPSRRGGAKGDTWTLDLSAQPQRPVAAGALPAAQRGTLSLGLKALEFFGVDLKGQTAAALGRQLETRLLKGPAGRHEPGLYRLTLGETATFTRVDGELPPADGPILVFLHGTMSCTLGSFGDLCGTEPAAAEARSTLQKRYGERIYALEHRTLSETPAANALALAAQLPAGAELHLVSHSRGGLVGELLCLAQREGAGLPGRDVIAPAFLDRIYTTEDDPPPSMSLGRLLGQSAATREDAYAEDRDRLVKLAARLDAQQVRVTRFVRVACPARGTSLASGRLDRWLSVLGMLMPEGLASDLTDFLLAVVKERTDPRTLPGLEAMMPGSGLTKLLQWPGLVTQADLSAITGDLAPEGRWGKLKLLALDWFFAGDHDLVVNTGSMSGGLQRPPGQARFREARGPLVTHFRYFTNPESLGWMLNGLVRADNADGGFQPIALAVQAEPASRAALRASRAGGSNKPVAIVVPGTMGSALKVDDSAVWLNYRALLVGGLGDIGIEARGVKPVALLEDFYGPLLTYLSQTHAVYEVPYDWRLSVQEAARRLTTQLETVLIDAEKNRQPVRIVAHSMGGLVARAMIADKDRGAAAWARMIALPQSRLLMLGTPNRGSYEAVRWLTGFNPTQTKLTLLDLTRGVNGIIDIVRRYPGLAELLPFDSLAGARDFADPALWRQLRDELKAGFPPAEDDALKPARATWELLRQAPPDPEHMIYVAGSQPATVVDYEVRPDSLEGSGLPQLQFIATPDGDGTVPWSSGRLEGVTCYVAPDTAHDDLCANTDDPRIFRGYVELLQSGRTSQLPALPAAGTRAGRAAADAERRFVLPPEPAVDSLPDEATLRASGFGARAPRKARAAARVADSALKITLHNADLNFIAHPLVIGHYLATQLTGTEKVVDRLIGGAMHESLAAGLYAEGPGTQQIFQNLRGDPINPRALPRPVAVIVAGLGEEGKLKASDLVMTVRQAVIAFAQRRLETGGGAGPFELAATLLGSGGTGISAGTAAQAIATGVREANRRLAQCRDPAPGQSSGWPTVSHLHLVELYLERASEAWQGLKVQAESAPGQFDLHPRVEVGQGAIRRPVESAYRGSSYDFISAVAGLAEPMPPAPPPEPSDEEEDTGAAAAAPPPPAEPEPSIAYTLDTRRARTEVRAQATQGRLLKELVRTASNEANNDPAIGRALFKLLIPVEMEPFLGGGDDSAGSDLVIELDDSTAGIPWELLDTRAGHETQPTTTPWAIRVKLLRKLRSSEFRHQVQDAGVCDDVLVIGEPKVNPRIYGPLPGARAEAQAVLKVLTGPAGLAADRVRALIAPGDGQGPGNREVITALLERDYRVVHIAGHGEASARGGVVLSNKTFLGPHEIRAMRKVPELVFLNCCHLARDDELLLKRPVFNRSDFAAGVAKELIRIGVRCVIAAGWAVDDAPAELFARSFYEALVGGGLRFIDAVALARKAAWSSHPESNTWAAYQCYGDPDWRWRQRAGDPQAPSGPAHDEFAGVASPVGLALALENLLARVKFQGADAATQVAQIQRLEDRFAEHWGSMGAIAEAFGMAYAECREDAKALAWLDRAVTAGDGSASIKSTEQAANVRVRAARRLEDIEPAVTLLEQLSAMRRTVERSSLLGSAHKRRAMLLAASPGDDPVDAREQEIAALETSARHYGEAEQLAAGSSAAFYPAMNRLAVQSRLRSLQRAADPAGAEGSAPAAAEGARPRRPGRMPDGASLPRDAGLDPAAVQAMRQVLDQKVEQAPDFWSVAGQTELRLLEAVAAGTLDDALPALLKGYGDLHDRVAAPRNWASVYDQARFLMGDGGGQPAAEQLLELLAGFAQPGRPA